MAITAEVQKGHTYYRCTKKSKTRKCSQKFIRQEELERQLSMMLREHTLPVDWDLQMLQMAENEQAEAKEASRAVSYAKQAEIADVKESLNRLLSLYLTGDIDRETFAAQKELLLSKKKALHESVERYEKNNSRTWLEPFREWVKTARTLGEIAEFGT